VEASHTGRFLRPVLDAAAGRGGRAELALPQAS
jgi:hypothetical protein